MQYNAIPIMQLYQMEGSNITDFKVYIIVGEISEWYNAIWCNSYNAIIAKAHILIDTADILRSSFIS